MGQTPRELNPFESARHFFGAELRHWRTLRGISQGTLGQMTHDSGALIGRFEKAERWPNQAAVQRLDAVLDTGGVLARIWDRAEREVQTHSARRVERSSVDPGLGLTWDSDLRTTVTTVAVMWATDAELETRPVSWEASHSDGALFRWLRDSPNDAFTGSGPRRISAVDVEAVGTMAEAFTYADHQLGGGYARSTLAHYLVHVVKPLLSSGYDDVVGSRLLAVAARLCNLAGFMSFDSGHQGVGQRYFIQALRLAKAIGDDALSAHVFGDMTLQALHLDARSQATALAEAGVSAARRHGSGAVVARAHALLARAYARDGAVRAADAEVFAAERALDSARPADDPSWNSFFDSDQLMAEFLYTAADLGRMGDVESLAATVLIERSSMKRRHVLATATVAGSYVPEQVSGGGQIDPQRALQTLRGVLPVISGMSSARGLAAVNDVRARLASSGAGHDLRQFEDDYLSAMSGTG